MTVEAVAARAGVSKPTIYRRWPEGKAELVAAAIAGQARGQAACPDTGSLRGDLLATCATWSPTCARTRSSPAGLVHQLRDSAELAEIFREQVVATSAR